MITTTTTAESDYDRIARAIEFIETHVREQPGLDAIAAAIGLSPFHAQRLFRRWAGVSPKRFLQALTVAHARRRLDEDGSVLDASLDVGLSGPSRLHDHFVALDAVTPGEYKQRGADLVIGHGVHEGPFGRFLLAVTSRGICGLAFLGPETEAAALASLHRTWHRARFEAAPERTASFADRLWSPDASAPLPLFVQGTNFQVQVWQALLRIPEGCTSTYGAVAEAIGRPGASRAVGAAVGANPIGAVIPCHRVIRRVGGLGGYRWGTTRKAAMLAREAANAAG